MSAADPVAEPPPDVPTETTGPYHDLAAFQELPRLAGLALSPDGTRLVTGVATPDPTGARFRTALWEIDPTGERPARRLTRGTATDASPVFAPDGALLFTSARPDPARAEQTGGKDGPSAALWELPVAGEPRVIGQRPGGIVGPVVARDRGTVVAVSPTHPAAGTAEEDDRIRTLRRDRRVTAILHSGTPVRYWDADLGPDRPRLLVGEPDPSGSLTWRDLAPDAGVALLNAEYVITPDGTTVVTTWRVAEPTGVLRATVVAIDVATGSRRVLVDDPDHDVVSPVLSPDGTRLVCTWNQHFTPGRARERRLRVQALDGGPGRDVAPGWDRWADEVIWTPDGSALLVAADEHGRHPLFRIDLGDDTGHDTGDAAGDDTVRRLTRGGSYHGLQVSPDGRQVYALRSAVDAAPAPVRCDTATVDQDPVALPGPTQAPTLPGTLTEVTTTAADGTALRAWLVLPDGADAAHPAPLLLWVHGGPVASWNDWTWRWNPWLMAARGWAVLLPDPALSTGYGQAMIQRGWGTWGAEPYTDVLALTDEALTRPDLDAGRTAAMGGSFGGYMANWIAGHTDRFAAIVSHAGLWHLEAFGTTTDLPWFWRREMTEQMAAEHSPHRHADAITTPMLVIHGDRDHRVPMGQALSLWTDLTARHTGDPAEMAHRLLYYPDENHWILTPHHARLWYETVFAFLDQHVLGREWVQPDLV